MYIKSAQWLYLKSVNSNIRDLSAKLNLEERTVENLLIGDACPSSEEILHYIKGFDLNSDETIELITVVAEDLEMSPKAIYDSVVEKMVVMTEGLGL